MLPQHLVPGYDQAVRCLKASFHPQKGIPIVIGEEKTRLHFSATTSTALLGLHYAHELSDNERSAFHRALLNLRKNKMNPQDIGKPTDAEYAWDAQEGASAWMTALALWALIATRFQPRGGETLSLHKAVEYICDRYNREQGYGPAAPGGMNYFRAAVILKALRLAKKHGYGPGNRINQIIGEMVMVVRQSAYLNHERIAWCGSNGTPDPTMTMCGLWMLREQFETQDEQLIHGAVAELQAMLHGTPGMWDMTTVYTQLPLPGQAPQVFTSYTPSLVIPLLSLGIDPFDPLIMGPMQWLKQHLLHDTQGRAIGWSNEPHGTVPLSFSTAYGIWAITLWTRSVTKHLRQRLGTVTPTTVFVVHGRDDRTLLEVNNALHRLGILHPVVLQNESSDMRTIIEHLMTASNRSNYAVIVMTPDDQGAYQQEPLQPRARQNVILEAGLFLGLLGRERMCLLKKGNLELPSDLAGIRYIDLDQTDWPQQLKQTLQRAGFSIQ